MQAPKLEGKKLCFVSILRAGNGLLDGMLALVPSARVGHVGLYRDPASLEPVEYYMKLPEQTGDRPCITLHPLLATGTSATAAQPRIQDPGGQPLKFAPLSATPRGTPPLNP